MGTWKNVATGREDRVYHITIGGESQTALKIANSGIIQFRQQRIAEDGRKILRHQIMALVATTVSGNQYLLTFVRGPGDRCLQPTGHVPA